LYGYSPHTMDYIDIEERLLRNIGGKTSKRSSKNIRKTSPKKPRAQKSLTIFENYPDLDEHLPRYKYSEWQTQSAIDMNDASIKFTKSRRRLITNLNAVEEDIKFEQYLYYDFEEYMYEQQQEMFHRRNEEEEEQFQREYE